MREVEFLLALALLSLRWIQVLRRVSERRAVSFFASCPMMIEDTEARASLTRRGGEDS